MKNNLKLAKQGDADAFGRLYQTIYQDLYRFALYTLKNPADAEPPGAAFEPVFLRRISDPCAGPRALPRPGVPDRNRSCAAASAGHRADLRDHYRSVRPDVPHPGGPAAGHLAVQCPGVRP